MSQQGRRKKGGEVRTQGGAAVIRDESVWGGLLFSGLPVDAGCGPARFYPEIRKGRRKGKRGGAKGSCHVLCMRQPWAWDLLYQSGVFGAEKREHALLDGGPEGKGNLRGPRIILFVVCVI